MRRVVVTGLGLVSPLGCGVEETWTRLLDGQSGAAQIDRFDVSDLPCKIACAVPGKGEPAGFDPDDWVDAKEQRRIDTFILYSMAAATQALKDADWMPEDEERRIGPFFIPGSLINLCSGQIAIKYGFKGPNHAVVTACSSGAHAIGDASRLIKYGDADVMVAGGAESALCRLGIAGFSACKALSTGYNDEPARGSRPYDQDRDGFVMGEGAGVVVLEEYEHAKARGAKIYAEVRGYGLSGDAYHITAPAPDGDGGYRAMQAALKNAGMVPGDVDYINAHGTSTPLGDEIEVKAVTRLMGDAAAAATMSSTKSSIGHLLGAAGAVEAVFCVLAMRDQVAPPTINLDNPNVDTPLDLAPHTAVKREIRAAISNSFGFGGTNASLVLSLPDT